ncbi:MAG: hypothetical protein AAGF93_16120 [Cyanobacteria bacterium P01_H01_bin.105]
MLPPGRAATVSTIVLPTEEQPIAETVNLLEQGRRHYRSGRFSEAIRVWQQAAHTYQAQENPTNQAP